MHAHAQIWLARVRCGRGEGIGRGSCSCAIAVTFLLLLLFLFRNGTIVRGDTRGNSRHVRHGSSSSSTIRRHDGGNLVHEACGVVLDGVGAELGQFAQHRGALGRRDGSRERSRQAHHTDGASQERGGWARIGSTSDRSRRSQSQNLAACARSRRERRRPAALPSRFHRDKGGDRRSVNPSRRGLFLLLDFAAYTSEQLVPPILVAVVAALIVEPVGPSVPVAVVRGGNGLLQGQSARTRTSHLPCQVARVPFHLSALLQGDPLPPWKGLVLESVRVVRREERRG